MSKLIDRRDFMLSAAAAAGASWFNVPTMFARSQRTSDTYGSFPMGIQSYTLRNFSVSDALGHVSDLGLHYIEFFGGHYEPTHSHDEISFMDQQLADHDIRLRAHGVNGFGDDHEANERLFWFARMAGIKTITADPAPESFDSLDELVRQFNIRIAIHNHGPGHRYDHPDDVLNAVEGRDERIGACADLGHYIRSGVDPVDAIHALGERLYGVHLKDFEGEGADAQETIIGDGVLDIEAFFEALHDVRFPADGALSLEYELNPDDPIDDIREGLNRASNAAQAVTSERH